MNLRSTIAALTTSIVLSGCITTQGGHTYVEGKCVTCINNPVTGEPLNYDPSSQPKLAQQAQSNNTGLIKITRGNNSHDNDGLAADGCRKPINEFDRWTHHTRDKRWCDDSTLPRGGILGKSVRIVKVVPVDVDIAYIRAKHYIRFTDPDDEVNVNNTYNWDGIAGKYYNIKGFYGGPNMRMLWYAKYNLEIERISANKSRVSVEYHTYGLEDKTKQFEREFFAAIRQ